MQELLDSHRLTDSQTSAEEIGDLLHLVEQYLADAHVEAISADLRFAAAYQAALQLATIPLRCAGYRTTGEGRHVTAFQALPLIMGESYGELADYCDTCRRKRHEAEYRRVGRISPGEVTELIEAVASFRHQVKQWLEAHRRESGSPAE